MKPVLSEDYSSILFLIRTPWAYTSWSRVTFHFLAEYHAHLEAGYYHIDTKILGACTASKFTQVLLPFHSDFDIADAKAFIHGFEISSLKMGGVYSPFEVQIINLQANGTGLALTISTTTVTQVHSLLVSYIAYST